MPAKVGNKGEEGPLLVTSLVPYANLCVFFSPYLLLVIALLFLLSPPFPQLSHTKLVPLNFLVL